MKNENLAVEQADASHRVRERIVMLRRREPFVWNGIRLGIPEIIGLSLAGLLSLIALLSYFNYLIPARTRLNGLQSENARLQTELRNATEGVTRGDNAQASVTEILQSMSDFEAGQLAGRNEGRTFVIEELNNLIRQNSLRIAGAANFTPLDAQQSGASGISGTARMQGRNEAASVFPGIGITLTVEGAYGNLRRFIRNIETSRYFIVIGGVEFENATADTNAARSLVSLRLSMVAYFRREGIGSGIGDGSALPNVIR